MYRDAYLDNGIVFENVGDALGKPYMVQPEQECVFKSGELKQRYGVPFTTAERRPGLSVETYSVGSRQNFRSFHSGFLIVDYSDFPCIDLGRQFGKLGFGYGGFPYSVTFLSVCAVYVCCYVHISYGTCSRLKSLHFHELRAFEAHLEPMPNIFTRIFCNYFIFVEI